MSPLPTCRVALLGAESTGKTALAEGLGAHVQAQGLLVALVPEYLRTFAEYRMLVFGAVMVLMMIFRPQGLISNMRRKYDLSAVKKGKTDGSK